MTNFEVRFEDVDGDGDREVVIENPLMRAVLTFPEKLGEGKYGQRFSWGGRMQSLIYKPTGREYFMKDMIDPEDVRPFGLPDEIFANFPIASKNGRERYLKVGVGVLTVNGENTMLEPLPWTWHQEQQNSDKVVVFRQEAVDLEGYSFVYEKRYRFRSNAAWFAMDVVWKNNGDKTLESEWDIHPFHVSGKPPHSSWLLAPKRAWVSYGKTRLNTVLKEASPIFATSDINVPIADRIQWDMDEPGWWYALGPGDGEEFYLFRGRFEPRRGLFWHAWGAFTPQGIDYMVVPPGETATCGFDVTLGTGGKNFVKAGEDCGITIDLPQKKRTAIVGVHVSNTRQGRLTVHVTDQSGSILHTSSRIGSAKSGEPMQTQVELPVTGDFVILSAWYEEKGRDLLYVREIVPLASIKPTSYLPFSGNEAKLFITSDPEITYSEMDGLYLQCHGTQCGFVADWTGPGIKSPKTLDSYSAVCIVGDSWPLERIDELRNWVHSGGGLLICAPFGQVATGLGELIPMEAQRDGRLEIADPALNLEIGTPHITSQGLLLHPDASVKIAAWTPSVSKPQGVTTLRFTDRDKHPAVVLSEFGKGRVAAVASRPAWGEAGHDVIWDGWGQYHRACFGGLLGWVTKSW